MLSTPHSRRFTPLVVGLAGLLSGPSLAQAATDCTTVTEIPPTECEVLIDFYISTDGANWTDNTGWHVTNTPCSWKGVACSGGHVTTLDLHNNQLNGSIPESLGNLGSLRYLHLSDNQLSGSIPESLKNLSSLVYLYLHNNQLSGSIPEWLGNLSSLVHLYLSSNQNFCQ